MAVRFLGRSEVVVPSGTRLCRSGMVEDKPSRPKADMTEVTNKLPDAHDDRPQITGRLSAWPRPLSVAVATSRERT